MSFPNETIYLVLADIIACFCFPKISADVTGAFGFLAEGLYFLSTGHVFGSNTSASSWEALKRAIQNMIPVYSQQMDLVEKHKDLINLLKWNENPSLELAQAFKCELNQGVLNEHREIYPLTANIYVDNILGAFAFKKSTKSFLLQSYNHFSWYAASRMYLFGNVPYPSKNGINQLSVLGR